MSQDNPEATREWLNDASWGAIQALKQIEGFEALMKSWRQPNAFVNGASLSDRKTRRYRETGKKFPSSTNFWSFVV